MPNSLAVVLASYAVLYVVALLVGLLMLGLVPWAIISITRNVAGMRRELERLNLLLASSGAPLVRGDRGETEPVRWETRTGPLGRL